MASMSSFSSLLGTAGQAASSVGQAASSVGQVAGRVGRNGLAGVSSTVQTARDRGRVGYEQIRGGVAAAYDLGRAHVEVASFRGAGFGLSPVSRAWANAKKDAERKLLDLGAPLRAKIMFGLGCATKSALTADPDMCDSVRSSVESTVDVIWSDLVEYVELLCEDERQVIDGHKVQAIEELGVMGQKPMCCTPKWWRAWLLYHFLPFDRSFFGTIKDPVFWILSILSLVNLYGVRVIFFAIVLLMHVYPGPADEYQLVCYILGFKGSQFLSSGVLQAVIAAVKYYLCIHDDGTHSCDTQGPGANQDLGSGLVDFVGSCVLTWCAFLMLPYSTRSAGMRSVVDKWQPDVASPGAGAEGSPDALPEDLMMQSSSSSCCSTICGTPGGTTRGGRLRGLLSWDICCFFVSVVFAFVLSYVDIVHARRAGLKPFKASMISHMLEDFTAWEGHTNLFWARTFYAFLSFPFLVFLVPGLSAVLTKTTATGYNRNGACVPFMLHPMPEKKTK